MKYLILALLVLPLAGFGQQSYQFLGKKKSYIIKKYEKCKVKQDNDGGLSLVCPDSKTCCTFFFDFKGSSTCKGYAYQIEEVSLAEHIRQFEKDGFTVSYGTSDKVLLAFVQAEKNMSAEVIYQPDQPQVLTIMVKGGGD